MPESLEKIVKIFRSGQEAVALKISMGVKSVGIPTEKHKQLVEAVNQVAADMHLNPVRILVHNGSMHAIAYNPSHDVLLVGEKTFKELRGPRFNAFITHELDHKTKAANVQKMSGWVEKISSGKVAQSAQKKLSDRLPETLQKFSDFMEFSADDRARSLHGAEALSGALKATVKSFVHDNPFVKFALFPDLSMEQVGGLGKSIIEQRIDDIANGTFKLPKGHGFRQLTERFERLNNSSKALEL